ncbi:MAG: class I SAM-dependent methyltransferase [Myxococcota bacterium]
MSLAVAPVLTAAEAAIYESLVVSRYMQPFAAAAVPMLIPHAPAIVAQLCCRTGYPAAMIGQQLPGCSVTGVDSSPAALELARTKARVVDNINVKYVAADALPTPLQGGAFTHAIDLHPFGARGQYDLLFAEYHRLLTSAGQLVMSLPLRGSFPEVYDILREYALRHDQPHFGESVDSASAARPNPETLSSRIEAVGFYDIDVSIEMVAIRFDNGRDFLDDPIHRLVVAPEVISFLGPDDAANAAWSYVHEAVGKYWSEIPFELTVNIGTVSARKG